MSQAVRNITIEETLSTQEILQLSPYSTKYIVPYKQERSKMFGAIFYNLHGRPRGLEEVDNMACALQDAGFCVIKEEWSDSRYLSIVVDGALRQGGDNCCLLIACFMSHGAAGVLTGANNSRIPINDILHQFTRTISDCLPMVTNI